MKEPQDGCETGCGGNKLLPAESRKQNTQQLTIILRLIYLKWHQKINPFWQIDLLGSRAESSSAFIRVKIELLSSPEF